MRAVPEYDIEQYDGHGRVVDRRAHPFEAQAVVNHRMSSSPSELVVPEIDEAVGLAWPEHLRDDRRGFPTQRAAGK